MPDKLVRTEQYRAWAALAQLYLENAELWEFVVEDTEEPTSAGPKKIWKTKRSRAVLVLAKLVGGEVDTFVQNEDLVQNGDPHIFWTKIKTRYNSLTYSSQLDILIIFPEYLSWFRWCGGAGQCYF